MNSSDSEIKVQGHDGSQYGPLGILKVMGAKVATFPMKAHWSTIRHQGSSSFTALHALHASRFSHEKDVCLSVCPSV